MEVTGINWNRNLTGMVLHIVSSTKTNGEILQKLLWTSSVRWRFGTWKKDGTQILPVRYSLEKKNSLAIKNLRELPKYIQIHHAGTKNNLKTPRERNHINLIARSVYSRLVGKPLALFDSLPKIQVPAAGNSWFFKLPNHTQPTGKSTRFMTWILM